MKILSICQYKEAFTLRTAGSNLAINTVLDHNVNKNIVTK